MLQHTHVKKNSPKLRQKAPSNHHQRKSSVILSRPFSTTRKICLRHQLNGFKGVISHPTHPKYSLPITIQPQYPSTIISNHFHSVPRLSPPSYFSSHSHHISFRPASISLINTHITSPTPVSCTFPPMSQRVQEFICLDAFARRQFLPGNESGFISADPEGFLQKVYELVAPRLEAGDATLLHDGYAPFCKHIFIENFTDAKPASIKITDENRDLIETSYSARTEKELPVLTRFIPIEKLGGKSTIPNAKYLDLILYSREQITIENQSMGNTTTDIAAWGIISIKAQNEPFETPMLPITMMRNSLGKDQGGSGVPLDANEYKKSVEYWKDHISLQ